MHVKGGVRIIKTSKLTAENFSTYFAGIHHQQTQKSLPNCDNLLEYPVMNSGGSCYFAPMTEREVVALVDGLKSKRSGDHYGMSAILLKKVVKSIKESLAHIFNCCLVGGLFPDEFKIARTVSVHKKGDIDHLDNYRPTYVCISFLPIISKILERAIANRQNISINSSQQLP